MHEIPLDTEQLLRAQGITDDELDELRRTGRLVRSDASGRSTIDVTMAGSSVQVDGVPVGAAQIPPEVLEKLRKYHRFIPKATLQQMEITTGTDIDGDGRIGGGAVPASSRREDPFAGQHAAAHPTRSSVPPASGALPPTSGPFVSGGPDDNGLSLTRLIIIAIVIAAIAWYFLR